MKTRTVSLAAIPLFAFMYLALSGCPGKPPASQVPVKVGVMLPLTGSTAFIGENIRDGMQLAVKEAPLEQTASLQFVFEDHKNSPKDAVAVFQRFLQDSRMPIIVPTLTSIANAVIPLVSENPRVLLGTVISGSDMPDKSEWLFRYFLSTPDEVAAMVRYMDFAGIGNVGVYYVNDDYGLDAAKQFRSSFGGKIAFEESFDKSTTDFKNLVPKATGAQAVYVLAYGTSYGTFVRQLREFGYKGKILCFSSFGTPVAIKQAGTYADGVIFTGTALNAAGASAAIDSFAARYEREYGRAPDHYSLYGHDIASIIMRADSELSASRQEVTPVSVRQTILGWKEYTGLFGRTTIARNKDFKFQDVRLFTTDKNGAVAQLK